MIKKTGLIHVACEQESALPILNSEVGEIADIVECGSELIFRNGVSAITRMKEQYPRKEVVADIKMTPLVTFHHGELFYNSGADAMIITGTKYRREMQPVLDMVKRLNKKIYVCTEIEPEETIDIDMLKMYKEIGIEYLIYHSIKREAPYWTKEDIENVRDLCKYGFNISVTGHISPDTVKRFKDVPIYSFIVGSSIMNAQNPVARIQEYKKIIKESNC